MSTDLSRREFLGATAVGGAAIAGTLATSDTTAYGFDLRPAAAHVPELKIARTRQTHSVCPYCAVGCGVVIHTLGDQSDNVRSTVVHVEGDTVTVLAVVDGRRDVEDVLLERLLRTP